MAQKRMRPAPRERADLGNLKTSTVFSSEYASHPREDQAVRWLRKRLPLPIATARTIIEVNGLGGVQ